MAGLVSGGGGKKSSVVIELTGRLDRKSFESLKLDIKRVAKSFGLQVRKLKLKGAPKRTKKAKKKK